MITTILRRSVLAGLLACGAMFAQAGAEADVKKAEEAWASTVSKGNVAEAAKVFADDLVYTHSSGVKENKTEYLAKLKSGVQVYKSISFLDQKIKVWGDSALMTGTVRMTGATKGVPFDNTMFVTHVWAKQGGAWKMLAHQTTMKVK